MSEMSRFLFLKVNISKRKGRKEYEDRKNEKRRKQRRRKTSLKEEEKTSDCSGMEESRDISRSG